MSFSFFYIKWDRKDKTTYFNFGTYFLFFSSNFLGLKLNNSWWIISFLLSTIIQKFSLKPFPFLLNLKIGSKVKVIFKIVLVKGLASAIILNLGIYLINSFISFQLLYLNQKQLLLHGLKIIDLFQFILFNLFSYQYFYLNSPVLNVYYIFYFYYLFCCLHFHN